MRILYVHHVRNFDSKEAYNSNSYVSANISLYGAQELDTWGGIRLLSTLADIDRFEISPNLNSSRFIEFNRQETSLVEWSELSDKKSRLGEHKLASLLTNNFDPSVSFWQKSKLVSHFLEVLMSNRYDLIWVDTQFYLPLLGNNKTPPVVIRSVNFEPRHVLTEDYSRLRYLKVLPKTLTEIRASRIGRIVGISPRDMADYRKIGIQTSLLPLRQLPFILECEFKPTDDLSSLYFCGSSYDVLHNRKNLIFIMNEIAPTLKRIAPDIKIKISGNRFPIDQKTPDNVIQVGFLTDLQSRLQGALSVLVPYSGGAGMQSKAFESLSIGSRVIANPDAIAGYPFVSHRHYTPARNAREFIEAISFSLRNKSEVQERAQASRDLALSIFSRQRMLEILRCLLEEYI